MAFLPKNLKNPKLWANLIGITTLVMSIIKYILPPSSGPEKPQAPLLNFCSSTDSSSYNHNCSDERKFFLKSGVFDYPVQINIQFDGLISTQTQLYTNSVDLNNTEQLLSETSSYLNQSLASQKNSSSITTLSPDFLQTLMDWDAGVPMSLTTILSPDFPQTPMDWNAGVSTSLTSMLSSDFLQIPMVLVAGVPTALEQNHQINLMIPSGEVHIPTKEHFDTQLSFGILKHRTDILQASSQEPIKQVNIDNTGDRTIKKIPEPSGNNIIDVLVILALLNTLSKAKPG